jgi:hypothetical protein
VIYSFVRADDELISATEFCSPTHVAGDRLGTTLSASAAQSRQNLRLSQKIDDCNSALSLEISSKRNNEPGFGIWAWLKESGFRDTLARPSLTKLFSVDDTP